MEETKRVCSKCGIEKPMEDYPWRSAYHLVRQKRCKACAKMVAAKASAMKKEQGKKAVKKKLLKMSALDRDIMCSRYMGVSYGDYMVVKQSLGARI